MRKLTITSKSIRTSAERFAAQMARLEELRLRRRAERPLKPKREGRVYYSSPTPRLPRVVCAKVKDRNGHEWTATGPTCRDAYQAVLDQLEKAAGAGDETARALLSVIEEAPKRPPRKRDVPPQGSLL